MDGENTVEVHTIIHGQVQGVGFRFTARHIADELAIVGTVKNLPDGTVEVYAVGTRELLDQFLERLKAGAGRVDHIETSYSPLAHDYDGFQITF